MPKSSAQRTTPTERPSREADARQLELAREEGNAYAKSLRHMTDEVADAGGQQRAGDYIVGWAVEKAEGLWRMRDGKLEWDEPAEDENCHLEVAVCDAADARFVPYLGVQATLVNSDGDEIGPFDIPFVWHPGLYHYGRNLHVPGGGRYTLRLRLSAPEFPRHDRVNGRRYGSPVNVEFRDVQVTPGKS